MDAGKTVRALFGAAVPAVADPDDGGQLVSRHGAVVMSFMNQAVKDLAAFFNAFAELHNVNGTDLPCVVDTDLNKVRSAQDSEQYDGIFLTMVRLYVKKTDLPKRPVYGKVFRLDEKPYTVVDCADEAGVWVITLGLNDG